MTILALILPFLDGFIDLALKIIGVVRNAPDTPEQAKAQLDVLESRLVSTKEAVKSVQIRTV